MPGYMFRSSDEEKRRLRCHVANLEHALRAHKEARKNVEEENSELKRKNEELRRKNEQLEKEKEEIRKQRDRYRNMLFKANVKPRASKDKFACKNKKSKRGRKKGHKGSGRFVPEHIDYKKAVYLTHCPACQKRLKRSRKANIHIVEDIPTLAEIKTEVTQYEIEEQWCSHCKKKVRAKPRGVMPKSRLGINLLLYAMIQKYGAKSSWQSIVFMLSSYFNIKVSHGALVGMMHRAREWLGPYYDRILEEIRGSPVKHADETQWRVDGINHWLWGFFTEKGAYYTVEESRGKGVAEENLEGSAAGDILVRDDYPAYKNLPLIHQSCWAHLLRNSKEAANDPKASEEVKILHKQLKNMYEEMIKIIAMPLNEKGRERYYEMYDLKIKEIVQAKYRHADTKGIQTRIRNQNTNLITALKYKNVPLTNNLAERCIRPFVIARKMSGGSRSAQGAKTQAVNMSIFQTIKMQNLPMIPTLREYLLTGCSSN